MDIRLIYADRTLVGIAYTIEESRMMIAAAQAQYPRITSVSVEYTPIFDTASRNDPLKRYTSEGERGA
jgi:hypothetical protein